MVSDSSDKRIMKAADAAPIQYADRLLGNLQVDISATKQMLNWSPPFSFEDTFKLKNQ